MFVTERLKALESLQKIGERTCCYGSSHPWPHFCDCKYGGPPANGEYRGGENTGCPELANIFWVITNMTDREWETFLQYAAQNRYNRDGERPNAIEPTLGEAFEKSCTMKEWYEK